ncbi:MAG: hypothetical protein K2X03_11685 [Bryobacteraceae bacterium]|nr:hypothetical protein [Bryobacteraceae bacterium]
MDTRAKVIELTAAAGLTAKTLVVGFFDPVLAAHVERLAALEGPVTVSLLDPPDEILNARARAELVASLASVERVIIGDARGLVASPQVVDMTAADLASREALIARIRQR